MTTAYLQTDDGRVTIYCVDWQMTCPEGPADMGTGSASRFFYCAKASKADRDEGLEAFDVKHVTCRPMSDDEDDRTIQERLHGRKARNFHPTVKPVDLMRYLCRLVTPPGGVILDPFMGSGSTGKAAVLEGFRFIGIEDVTEHCEIAKHRILRAIEIEREEYEARKREARTVLSLPGFDHAGFVQKDLSLK